MEISGDIWKNTICVKQVSGTADTPPPTSAGIVNSWKDFMLAIHFPDVTLSELTLRNVYGFVGSPDHIDHPPVWTLAVGSVGTGNTTFGGAHNSNYLPQDATVYAKKTTVGGRSGKNFFRNILCEPDVASALGGAWDFSSHSGGWDTAVFNAAAVSLMGDFFGDPPATGDYCFAVAHLLALHDPLDIRVPFSTACTALVAQRPAWNKAKR